MTIDNQNTGIAGVLAANTELVKLADGMLFAEGPVWNQQLQQLIFSDTGANAHKSWSETSGLQTYRQPSYQPNGNVFDAVGNLYTCEHESRAVSMTNKDSERIIVCDRFHDRQFNSPNDLEIKSDGTIWFTDPPYGLGDRIKEIDFNGVFRYDPSTKELALVTKDLSMPNGIAFSPDENQIYIGNSAAGDRYIWSLTINSDGSMSQGKILCEIDNNDWGADGVDVDAKGNIYAGCGDGVHIFSNAGLLLGKISTPSAISNFAFGGKDGTTLFMTSEHALYRIELLVAGAVRH